MDLAEPAPIGGLADPGIEVLDDLYEARSLPGVDLEHRAANARIHDPDPSPYGDAPAEVEDAMHREWIGHLEPELLTAVRIKAQAFSAAQAHLTEAMRAARRDGRSWADIGAAVGISRQSAHERWAQVCG
ncbi:hypothetical protein ACFV1N_25270 [Streptosporangium canum]|uniref:hypothetical protein n=1 Tax=Streptosporangium canum TaxID=324952 RepID=UPI00367E4119